MYKYSLKYSKSTKKTLKRIKIEMKKPTAEKAHKYCVIHIINIINY